MRLIAIGLFAVFFTLTAGDFILADRSNDHAQARQINDGTTRYEAGLHLFKTHCQQCHGKWGDGNGTFSGLSEKPLPTLQSESTARSAKEIKRIIRDGGEAWGMDPMMPAWKTVLSENEINALAYFVVRLQHANGIRKLNAAPSLAD